MCSKFTAFVRLLKRVCKHKRLWKVFVITGKFCDMHYKNKFAQAILSHYMHGI